MPPATPMPVEAPVAERYAHLLRPIKLGPITLRNRIMVPPHGSGIGNLWGDEQQAQTNIDHWRTLARSGAAWLDAVRGRMRNRLIPGFEPSGYGAETLGNYRLPNFVERTERFVAAMHAEGAVVTSQLTILGGVPHGPSGRTSSPLVNARPHVMSKDDIDWFVAEYRFSAEQARRAGLDGIEVHLNHDDLLEHFLSPATNQRTDGYGGSLEARMRFGLEVLAAVREAMGPDRMVGARLNMSEDIRDGYTAEMGLELAQRLESSGLVDFLHLVTGSPWGSPSYIQAQFFDARPYAELAGTFRRELRTPVVYAGRVTSLDLAERIVAEEQADVVGLARAHIADPELIAKALAGRPEQVRPCVGGNDCISRQYVERLPFACAVNTEVGRAAADRIGPTATARRVLVIGGGPAGMEFAAASAEAGHRVALWEASERLGGQLALAARLPSYDGYADYLRWQSERLTRVGVEVRLSTIGTAAGVREGDWDEVVVATGAAPYPLSVPVAAEADVRDARAAIEETGRLGRRVCLLAFDDHLAPLTLARHLMESGHQVTVVYETPAPGQLLGRYIHGSAVTPLVAAGVEILTHSALERVEADAVTVSHVLSRAVRSIPADSVVVVGHTVGHDGLYHELRADTGLSVHLLGDAFAPRRLAHATRQAYALAKLLASDQDE